jgi:hypothetical protein
VGWAGRIFQNSTGTKTEKLCSANGERYSNLKKDYTDFKNYLQKNLKIKE